MQRRAALTAITLLLSTGVVLGQASKNLSTGQQVLAGTDWRLVSMGHVGADAPIVSGTTVTLKFGNDDRVGGSTGCNTFGGGYHVQGDRVTFSQIFSTRRACLEANANRQESEYVQALGSATRFRLGSNTLSIYYERGRSVLEFVKPNADVNEGSLSAAGDPVSALIAYYRAIDARDYRRAYRYWESPAQSVEQFVRGFSDTASVKLLVDPSPQVEGAAGSSYANISTIVISKRQNGSQRTFSGCYVMRKSNLGPEDGATRQGWRIYRADIQPVPVNARAASVLSEMCKP